MFVNNNDFEIIIVGGGHSGIEASYILSKMKCKVLLITFNKKKIGELSCNPSIGGLGKSNLVKEIDVLGGLMGKLVDLSGINFKVLNISKGYSVRATRVQIDKNIYKYNVNKYLNKYKKYLTILEDEVISLIIKKNILYGVCCNKSGNIYSKYVILCTGTFLDSKIFIGNKIYNGGRLDDYNSLELSFFLKKYFSYGYLKTGTPPRLKKKTIDFSIFKKQKSNLDLVSKFSFFNSLRKVKPLLQKNCYLTKTNKNTFYIVKNNINISPLFNGIINSKGPRYCPSLEDKIIRFKNKKEHILFLEPESINGNTIYPNGLSMCFPFNIQKKIVNSIKGMDKTKILIPGYAVKYMYLNPIFLNKTLESKIINNLFIAGQINGTTGYEEAAAQGLIAGINCYLKIKNKNLNIFNINRLNSYIGVLIDDLCTKGIKEPYRIFNSRSEYSLFLREDNADYRLISISNNLKLININKFNFFKKKNKEIKNIYNYLNNKIFDYKKLPNYIKNNILNKRNKIKIKSLICNNLIDFNKLKYFLFNKSNFLNSKFLEEVKILFIYEGYLKKQKLEISKYKFYENVVLPKNINYKYICGLSKEVIEILNYYKPNFLGQLLRISGVTPISLMIIYFYLKKNKLLILNK